jgi:uncharacterized protein (TIGR03085 family)
VTNLATTERAALADLLDRIGPDAPTLCEGWLTRDLVAHLVLREGRPDAAAGIVIGLLARWTARVQRNLASGDFSRLVHRLRTGPPRWSLFRRPRMNEAANNVEFFVHHEDIRRAQPDWQPRVLAKETEDLLWKRGRRSARLLLRSAPAGIVLVRADTGERHVARAAGDGDEVLTLTGTPQELVMYLYGRRSHAWVERDGDPDTLEVFERL